MNIVASPINIAGFHGSAVILSDNEEDDNDDSDVNVFHISSSNCLDDGISTDSKKDEDDNKFNLLDVDNIIINVNNVDDNITYKDSINDETPIITNQNIFKNATNMEDNIIVNASFASTNFAVKEEVIKEELPCLNALAKVELSIDGAIFSPESLDHSNNNSINHCDHNYASSLAPYEAGTKVEHDIIVDDEDMTMKNTSNNNSNVKNNGAKTQNNFVTIEFEFDALVDCDNKSSIMKSHPTNDSCNKKEGLVNKEHASQNSVSSDNIIKDNTLNDGTISNTPADKWKCELCGIEKRSKHCLANHLHIFHGVPKPYAGSLCQFQGCCESQVKIHTETHHRVKPFACKICGFQAIKQEDLENHIKTHTEEKPLACKQCDFQALCQVHLQDHMQACQQKPQGLFFCPTCNFSAMNKRLLDAHRRSMHWRQKRFICDKCDYRTGLKGNLTRHLATHEKRAKYECRLCDFKAMFKVALIRHQKSHASVKSFTCTECKYWTVKGLDFQQHMRIHSEDRKYPCSLCPYRAPQKAHLKRHMLSHVNEETLKCNKCDFQTTDKNILQTHSDMHSKNYVFKCPLCKYMTDTVAYLNQHLLSHAKATPKEQDKPVRPCPKFV